MTVRRLLRYWNRFFFAPIPPTAIALYRIVFGILVLADMALLWPDLMVWYGEKGAVTLETAIRTAKGARLNLFPLLPPGDLWVQLFFVIFVLFAFFLTIGLFTQVSSVIVFVGLVSIHHRNLFILNSGDGLLRITSFLLIFAPAGAAMSIYFRVMIRYLTTAEVPGFIHPSLRVMLLMPKQHKTWLNISRRTWIPY